MRMHLIFGLAAASLIAAPAAATARGEGSTPSTTAAKPSAEKGEKKICRRYEKPGSHASEKICLTRAQWDKIEREG